MIQTSFPQLRFDLALDLLSNNFLVGKFASAFYYFDVDAISPFLDDEVTFRFQHSPLKFCTKSQSLDHLKSFFDKVQSKPETYHVLVILQYSHIFSKFLLGLEYDGKRYKLRFSTNNGKVYNVTVLNFEEECQDPCFRDEQIFEQSPSVDFKLPKVGEEFFCKDENGKVIYFCKVAESNDDYIKLDGCLIFNDRLEPALGIAISSCYFPGFKLSPSPTPVFDWFLDAFTKLRWQLCQAALDSREDRDVKPVVGEVFMNNLTNEVFKIYSQGVETIRERSSRCWLISLESNNIRTRRSLVWKDDLDAMTALKGDAFDKIEKMLAIGHAFLNANLERMLGEPFDFVRFKCK